MLLTQQKREPLGVHRRDRVIECRIVDIQAQDSDLIEKLAELSFDAFRSHGGLVIAV